MSKIVAFLKDVRVELAKVSWPTRNETIRFTIAVIGISFALAIFLGILDAGYSYILNRFIVSH